MQLHRIGLAAALVLVCAAIASAQYPQGAVGFYVSTNTGHSAGSPCWWFSCTPATLNITAGEVVTVRINGEWHAPYLLATAPTATSCVSYPGILHSLVLDLPATIVQGGSLNSVIGILSCPNGYDTLTATVPAGIPLGSTIAIQALVYETGAPSFTGAIVLTII